MRADREALELKIQQLEEENLQLKGELDERPTLEDKQADEEYIDELRTQVLRLRIQRDKRNLALSATLQELDDMRDLCAAQVAMLEDLCAEGMHLQNQRAKVA